MAKTIIEWSFALSGGAFLTCAVTIIPIVKIRTWREKRRKLRRLEDAKAALRSKYPRIDDPGYEVAI